MPYMLNKDVSFKYLMSLLKAGNSQFKKLKIALLADCASQHFKKALVGAGVANNLNLEVWEAEYDALESYVYDTSSELYTNEFDYIFIFQSPLKLYTKYSREELKEGFASNKVQFLQNILASIKERTKAKVLLTNFAEIDDAVFGNYANKTTRSFLYQVRKLNLAIMEIACSEKNLFVVDVNKLVSSKGFEQAFDPKLYIHADLVFNLDFLALIAINTAKMVAAIQGSFKKCVILDLDNTLWGGIIGDDGLENIQIGDLGLGKAFTNLQIWLRNLKERGIILAVSSKNNESIAKEAFEKHPGMVLRLEDISVFAANWETKVDNILFIQSILNIGFDSMVFLDDNPFERNIVRQNIPDITVPELPEDPAEYLPFLQSLNLFETASFSGEDSVRTKQYQEEAGRVALQKRFNSEAEYLESLNMVATAEPVNNFTCPRVAQLSQRSNQFNLRTIRYTEDDIARIMAAPNHYTLAVSLIDSYGDYGLISAVILERISAEEIFIDTWIMSCRVLKRGVESYVLNRIVEIAKENGFKFIIGEYIATAKNGLVKDHFKQLGFEQMGDTNKWRLDVDSFKNIPTFIKNANSYVID